MITHGEQGLLAPANDHERIARHVLRLLDDPAEARQLARSAYAMCARCSWSQVREDWLRVYYEVMSEAHSDRVAHGVAAGERS
jgi:glycosyltransferase involved in cell wall biosynthesis